MNKEFNIDDSGISLLLYIVMQGVVAFVASSLLSFGIAYTNLFYYIYAFFIEGVFGFAVFFDCIIKKQNFASCVGFNKKLSVKLVILAVIISTICLIGLGRLSDYFSTLLQVIGYKSADTSISITTFGQFLVYTFIIGVVPAVCEELLFRGAVLSGLAKFGKNVAIYVSALSFMLMHGNPDQTIHQFILGVICGYIVYYTHNLWLSIIIHFCNNFFVLLVSYLYNVFGSGVAIETTTTATASVGVIIISVLIDIAIIALSAVLITSVVKTIVKQNKLINGKPSYLPEEPVVGEAVEEEEVPQAAAKKPVNLMGLSLLILANIYFLIDWILALIKGFLR